MGCALFDPGAEVRAARAQLNQAERRWRSVGIDSYEMTVEYSTFLASYGCARQSFSVVRGKARPVANAECDGRFRADVLGTVPALFRLARENLGGDIRGNEVVHGLTRQVELVVDPRFGVPVRFYGGYYDAEDGFFSFKVVRFEPKSGRHH